MILPSDVLVGVFGGTGLYSLLETHAEYEVETPFGAPSGRVAVGEISGRKVAFLPRHGTDHSIPPHRIPYLANVFAFRELGVRRIIAPTACGSLRPNIHPGSFVVSDQFVDRTRGRRDTFYDGPEVTHISGGEPYCPQLRELASDSIAALGRPVHREGTCVVVQGPRFSTRAESEYFTKCGWHTVNMTQYPEVVLARELEMCYVNIALVTDYDAGVIGEPGTAPVSAEEVVAGLKKGNENVRRIIERMVSAMPEGFTCSCGATLSVSRLG